MPVLLFTTDEVANSLINQQRKLSKEILALADLKTKPLNPGESVADRHHRLAKLARRLAEAFDAFDTVIRAATKEDEVAGDGQEPDDEPAAPDTSRAN